MDPNYRISATARSCASCVAALAAALLLSSFASMDAVTLRFMFCNPGFPVEATWWGDSYSVHPVLSVQTDGSEIPDGTYTVTCKGVDQTGWTVVSKVGGALQGPDGAWTVSVTVLGGVITSQTVTDTKFFNGNTSNEGSWDPYSTLFQWTQEQTKVIDRPAGAYSVEAVVEPLVIKIKSGLSCERNPATGVVSQQVTLMIKGCESCDGDGGGCKANGFSAHARSLYFNLGLGEGFNHRGTAHISFESSRPTLSATNPEKLYFGQHGLANRVKNASQWVFESANSLANIVVEDKHRYRIYVYNRDDATWDGGNQQFVFNATPVKTLVIENPDAPADRTQYATTYDRLRITEDGGVRTFVYNLDVATDTETWSLLDGAGNLLEKTTETPNGTKTRQVFNSGGTVATAEVIQTTDLILGQINGNDVTRTVPTQTTSGTGGTAQTVTQEFYDSTAPAGSVGLVRLRQEAGRPWERYQYDANGRLNLTVIQVGNNAPDSAASVNREIETQQGTYSLPSTALDIPSGVTQLPGFVTIERELGLEVSRRYHLAHHGFETAYGKVDRSYDIQCVTPGASSSGGSNLVTYQRVEAKCYDFWGDVTTEWPGTATSGAINPVNPYWHRGAVSQSTFNFSPDGTMSSSSRRFYVSDGDYLTGLGFTPGTDSAQGAPAAGLRTLASGERSSRIFDLYGRWTSATSYFEPGSVVLETATVSARDNTGMPTQITYSDGSQETTTSSYCCGPAAQTDRSGAVTNYTYDSEGRQESVSRDGVRMRTVFDGGGHVLEIYRGQVTTNGQLIGSEQRIGERVYDTAGRLTETRDAAGRVTTIVETTAGDGTRKVKSTQAGAGSRTEIYFADGRLKAIGDSGDTAAYPRKYEYGVASGLALPGGATTNARHTKEIMLGAGGEEQEWTKTYTDMAGRVCRVETAAAGATHPTTYQYNGQGQLVKMTDPDGVTLLYAYNARGEPEVEALDLNRDGIVNNGGTDRITKRVATVAQHGGVTVRRATTSRWQEDNADTPTVISQVDTTPNGLHAWSTSYGLTTERTIFQNAGNATTTTIFPDNSQQIESSSYGRINSRTKKDANGVVLGEQTFAYNDSFKRLTSVTDARDGTTNFTYYPDDQIEIVTGPDPDGGGPLARPVTHSYYDNAGRKNRDVLPDGGEVFCDYWPTGDLKSTSGARTYPVEYTYDTQGRLKTLTTHGSAGNAVTTWVYSPTGRLEQKKYHNGVGPTYTYTDAGRMMTRLWVRGITTTYGHNNAGEVNSVIYSNATTPAVGYGFNRCGLLSSVTDASGSRTLTYTADGQPDDDQYTAGTFAGITIDRGYDAKLRLTSLAVAGVTGVPSTAYGYDEASRLRTVTSGTSSATYTRVPNSELIGQIDFARSGQPVMSTTKSYDFLDRLTSISSTVAGAGSPISASSYLYNAVGQRTRQTREDGSYWDYGYDSLGQVTGGSRKWSDGTAVPGQQFGYGYDQIGNRTGASVNGRQSTYAPNLLNQYTSRTVPGAVDVQGQANAAAIVTVNGKLTTRKGQYYAGTVPVDNGASPVDAQVKVVGVRNNADASGHDAVTEQTGRTFVPQTPESFAYDQDGNLTSDGQFTYIWDGENRLLKVEPLVSTPTSAKVKLAFLYDAQGRRIAKDLFTWNPVTSQYEAGAAMRFLYNNWTIMSELNSTNQRLRSYSWGLDSGGVNGSNGVGGLLGFNEAATNSDFLFAFDGNGNISNVISVMDGSVAATYEYGPFGEQIRGTGPVAASNAFRWSTKYFDRETQLTYYGYRFYQPILGRWLSRDPLQEAAGGNLFSFVANRPIARIDYLGLVDELGITIASLYSTRAVDGFMNSGLGNQVNNRFDFDLDNWSWLQGNRPMNEDTAKLQPFILDGIVKEKLRNGAYTYNAGSGPLLLTIHLSDNVPDNKFVGLNIFDSSDTLDERFWLGRTYAVDVSGQITLVCLGGGRFKVDNFDVRWKWPDIIDANPAATQGESDWKARVERGLPEVERITHAQFHISVAWRNSDKLEKTGQSPTKFQGRIINVGKIGVGAPSYGR